MKNKKGIIILGLLVLVAAAYLFQFINANNNIGEDEELHCEFSFMENLAVVSGNTSKISIRCDEKYSSLEVLLDDSIIHQRKDVQKDFSFFLDSKSLLLGAHNLKLIAHKKTGESSTDERLVRILSNITPEKWTANISNTFPHNDSSFTQGLLFSEGVLYEGTGDPNQLGKTMIAQVDMESGKIIRKIGLEIPYFGEGIAVVGDDLYQLTWMNQSCFVYNKNTFENTKKFEYTGEGWGLCYNGQQLIMSDGTERLTFRNPKTFQVERTIEVYTNEGPIVKLNELEYVNGLIYANVWTTNSIVVIDPANGAVMAIIDANALVLAGKGNGEVLNGIAYNSKNKKLYMTGKFWPKLFEVTLNKNSTSR